MTALDIKAHWRHVYQNKAPSEVSWFQAEPTLSLELIDHCGLSADAPIIDVGGGASVLVDRLLGRGYSRLSVLDVATDALAVSRERLSAEAEKVQWIESDITAYSPQSRFALWHDRAVFHFLTDPADRVRYVHALTQALGPGGNLILASFAIGGPEKCSGLPVVQYDADRLLGELGSTFQLLEQRDENHVTPAGRTQAFTYFRLVRRPE